jgi:acyl carrier protein
VFEQVKDILSNTLKIEPERITMEVTIEELDVDSLGMVELSLELEEAFKLHIGDEELQELGTVGDIVRLIMERSVVGDARP